MKKQLLIVLLLVATININAQEVVAEMAETDTVENTELMETNELMTNTAAEGMTNTAEMPVPEENQKSMYVETVGYTITNGDHLYASPNARFEVQGVDEQSGLKDILVSINGGSFAPYKNPISFSTEGEHSLNYQFVDRVGNISYSKVFSLVIDATAPRVLDLQLDPVPYYASGTDYVGPNTEISFRSYDDMTGVAFIEYASQDQEMMRFDTNTTFAALGYTNTGTLQLSYQATDMVSNVSAVKSRYFVVDATAPTVDVFAKAVEIDGIRYISSKDTVYVEAYDNDTMVSNIMYAINDGEYQNYEAQIGVNLKEAGEYTVFAKAVDVVGNESEAVEYKVVVDMLAPTGNAMYIGEVRSSQYDPLAGETMTAEDPTSMSTMEETPVSTDTAVDTMVTEDPTSMSTMEETSVSAEMPAGTAVDTMVTEETPAQ